MISATEAASLIKRLEGLRGYPRHSPQAQAELSRALENAPTIDKAHAFIDDQVRSATNCPYPADVYTAFRAQPQEFTGKRCELCDGSGMQSMYELVTFGPAGYRILKREIIGPVKDYIMDRTSQPIREMQAKLPDNQDIRESARKCACRGAA